MAPFASLYQRVQGRALHPHSRGYLAGLSFVEAFAFPVAPELMLAPICIAQPRRACRYAAINLTCSLLGALAVYAFGYLAFDLLQPLLTHPGGMAAIDRQVLELRANVVLHPWTAFWLLLAAAFTPVRLKLPIWGAGIPGVRLAAVMGSMVVGRGKCTLHLARLVRTIGSRAEAFLQCWIERIGLAALSLLAVLARGWFEWRLGPLCLRP